MLEQERKKFKIVENRKYLISSSNFFVFFLFSFFFFFWDEKYISIDVIIKNRRIFDLFLYNGESDILYIRLWKLYPFVDHFIICFPSLTFSGLKNEISFSPYELDFKKYFDKVYIHFFDSSKVNKSNDSDSGPSSWDREHATRNALRDGLELFNPNDGDTIIMGDIDEIPNDDGIKYIIENPPKKDFYTLRGLSFYKNYLLSRDSWHMLCIIYYSRNMSDFQFIRDQYRQPTMKEILVFHCTYCFRDLKEYRKKFLTFAHTEFSGYPYSNLSYIFKSVYCKRGIHNGAILNDYIHKDLNSLVPNHPRLQYLISDKNYFNLSETIYKEEDLPNLCSRGFP